MLGLDQNLIKNPGFGSPDTGASREAPFFNVMPIAKVGSGESGNTVPAAAAVSPKIHMVETVTVPDMLKESGPSQNQPSQESKGTSPGVSQIVTPAPIKKYIPPAKAAFSGLIDPSRVSAGGKVKNLVNTFLKFLIGLVAVAVVGAAVWYTANSFGGSIGLPKLGEWLRSLPFINKTEPNSASSAGKEAQPGESQVIEPATENGSESDPGLTTAEWRLKFFEDSSCGQDKPCFDEADPDQDGLSNAQEFKQGTDPKNADSDQDGLADGDEINIFSCSPLDARTAGNADYTDKDDVVGGWRCYRKPGEEEYYNKEDLMSISVKIKQKGFHEPTLKTLGSDADWYLNAGVSSGQGEVRGASLPEGIESTEEARLDRDIQRLNTIKQIGIALVKYRQETGFYPDTTSFGVLSASVRPYLGVATNTFDPINMPPYEYGYLLGEGGDSFTLTYYSESQSQAIKYTSSSAQKDYFSELAFARDEQRMYDLDKLRSALLIVSAAESDAREGFAFPTSEQLEGKIVPQYLPKMPKDPITGKPYEYQAFKDRSSFTIKAVLEKAPTGQTGYLCNQEECRMY